MKGRILSAVEGVPTEATWVVAHDVHATWLLWRFHYKHSQKTGGTSDCVDETNPSAFALVGGPLVEGSCLSNPSPGLDIPGGKAGNTVAEATSKNTREGDGRTIRVADGRPAIPVRLLAPDKAGG